MVVYIVNIICDMYSHENIDCEFEAVQTIKIFSTKEKAEQFVSERKEDNTYNKQFEKKYIVEFENKYEGINFTALCCGIKYQILPFELE